MSLEGSCKSHRPDRSRGCAWGEQEETEVGGSGREQVIHRDLVLRVEWGRGVREVIWGGRGESL